MADARLRILTSGARKAAGAFRGIKQSAFSLGSVLGGIGAGFTLAAGAKAIFDFDKDLGRLQTDAGFTNDEIGKLRNRILELNGEFAVGKDKITGALQVFQEFGGHVREGAAILPELTKAAKASGAEMNDLATIAATMVNAGEGPKSVMKQLTAMQNAALAGTISIKDMARVIPELYGKGGAKGQTITSLVTALQTVGEVEPDVARARTSLLALFRDVSKKEVQPKLKKLGINPFKKDPKTGREVLRDIESVMAEILKKTKGKLTGPKGLNAIFTEESSGALAAFQKSFDVKTGKFGGTFGTIKQAATGGPQDIFEQQLKRQASGVNAGGEKLQQTFAKLEAGFQRVGKVVLGRIINSPAFAAFTTALAKAGEVAMPLIDVLSGILNPLLAFGKFIFDIGFAIGTLINKVIPLTDAIAYLLEWLGAIGGEEASKKRMAHAREATTKGAVEQQARELAALGKAGVTRFGAPGAQKELTQASALAKVAEYAKSQGLSDKEFKQMLPTLKAMLAELKKPPVVIGSPGIDKPSVVQATGPATS